MAKIKVYQTKRCMGIISDENGGKKVCNNPPTTYVMRGGERFYTCPGCTQKPVARAIDVIKQNNIDMRIKVQGSAPSLNMEQPGEIEAVFSPKHDKYYHISRGEDLVVYCDCPNWKFSVDEPRTCKHLLERGYYVKCGICAVTFANGAREPLHICDDFPDKDEDE